MLPLLVNHPHTPQHNWYVEQVHQSCDEEWYQVLDIPDTLFGMSEALEKYVYFIIIIEHMLVLSIVPLANSCTNRYACRSKVE